jgi:hypothetical protein
MSRTALDKSLACSLVQEFEVLTIHPDTHSLAHGLVSNFRLASSAKPSPFTVFLTKWCEEPVTVGSRGPQ